MSQQQTTPEPFPLGAPEIARIKDLAEACRSAGQRGVLGAWCYHDKGSVLVPAAWLAELIRRAEAAHA